MVAKVQAKWADLSESAQRWAKVGASLAGALVFLGTGARLDTVMGESLEPRVVSIEARMDTIQRTVSEQVRTQDYLICLSEASAGIGAKTPIECANDRIRAERKP